MDLFSLHWNNYHSEVSEALDSLRNDEDLVDVTISCDGKKLKAHKVLLSACSNYFRDIFKENPCQHPVIVFRNFKFKDLQAVVDYIYMGEVSVEQSQLESVLEIAQLLQVKGLTDGSENSDEESSVSRATENVEVPPQDPSVETSVPLSPPLKKRKISSYVDREGHPTATVKSSCLEPTAESDDNAEVRSVTEDGSTNITDVRNELQPILRSLTSDSKCGTDDLSEDKISVMKNTSKEDLQKKPAVQSLAQTSQKITKEKVREEPCNLPKPASILSNVKVTEAPTNSVTGSKKPKLEDKIVRSKKEQTASKAAAKQVRAGTVHIPKCLTVTVVTAEEQTSMESSDLHCAQPSEEDSVLRSENARTPVGEGVCSLQSSQCQQLEEVGFTSADQIQPGEPEMAEEAPQLESEQGSADVQADEEPEFDYYGCEICKSEAKAYDRLSFTHKCPICPCMCFCSHLLKEHMRVIHGWFNVQRKFAQNY